MRSRTIVGYAVAWLVLALALAAGFFLTSEADGSVAGHDAVVRPTLDGRVTLHTGPFLPDVRAPADGRVGVAIVLGKTEAASAEELVRRYAFIASQPDGQVARVEDTVRGLALDALLRGAVVGAVPLLLWAAVGARRRGELLAGARRHRAPVAAGTAVAVALAVLAWEPWEDHDPLFAERTSWLPLEDFVPVELPDEAAGVEVSGEATAAATRRLILSAVDTYRRSREFYARLVEQAETLPLRQPDDGETVAVLVSDRHDNVGMDAVARAIGDRAGATVVLDAGDDTSTGSEWEAFSLDSLQQAFEDYDRYAVTGNHDHGGFVRHYLADRGWEVASGEVVEGPGGGRLLAYDDPRSSGLGNWRDEVGGSIGELAEEIADTACASEERVHTLLVHDQDMGAAALERGCVDLVLAGHLHTRQGPVRVEGTNGEAGHLFVTGTTGGAAYALAVGSKLRRPAMVTLVTYDADGAPVGLQPVTIQTTGEMDVAPFVPLA